MDDQKLAVGQSVRVKRDEPHLLAGYSGIIGAIDKSGSDDKYRLDATDGAFDGAWFYDDELEPTSAPTNALTVALAALDSIAAWWQHYVTYDAEVQAHGGVRENFMEWFSAISDTDSIEAAFKAAAQAAAQIRALSGEADGE